MSNRVKYFNHPAFSASDWTTRNPRLQRGEIGFELNNLNIPIKAKVGPGYWNDLPYIEFSYWDDTNPVTNPIGDAEGSLDGLTDRQILNLMLNPYQAPAFSNILNDAGGIFAAETILEIGQTLSANVDIQYSISNQANLSGATPINITSVDNIFSNEGDFPVGTATMTLAAALTPTQVAEYLINLVATHNEGTSQGTTKIVFYPRILWGVSQNPSILPTEWLTLSSKGSIVTNDFKGDYAFNASGYHWLAIPSMLSPGTPTFTDVTDPNAPAGYGMDAIGQETINNGVGSYAYETFRSTFLITQNNSILRVA